MVCICILTWIFSIVAVILLPTYIFLKSQLNYWKRRGLSHLEPHLFYGNIKKFWLSELAIGEMFLEIYKQLKAKGLQHGGFYMFFKPIYMPLNLEIIKCIMQKDFNHFVNREKYVNEKVDPITGHLFNLEDAKWKNLRAKLTPTFTSGKMKMMFHTLVECTYGLEEVLNAHAIIQDPVDIKDVLSRFTTDVIGSCAFGVDCNSLKDPDTEFRKYGKKIFEPDFITRLKLTAIILLPRWMLEKISYKVAPRDVASFFINSVKDIVEYREKNGVFRKDFMHLLLQLKNRGVVTDDEHIKENQDRTGTSQTDSALTINEIAAQCFVFFLAGFETSATTMTFALYELAENQEMQQKLREEVTSVRKRHDNKITYEAIMEMTYLDKVVHETLRKHPPAAVVSRVCNKSYNVPGTDIVIEEGTRVEIPIIGVHHDPEYYPNPEVFDPERFSEDNKAKRPAFTFLPFGEGPRICIGLRFGLMQSKVGLASIVTKYKITLNKKTQTPLRYDPKLFISSAKGSVWLNVSKLE